MKLRVLILILLVLTVGVAAFLYTRSGRPTQTVVSPTPTPYQLPVVNNWKGISPGSSTTKDLAAKLGTLSAGTQNGDTTTYAFPSTNQYWKNEVDVKNDTVTFIRERVFAPADTSLKTLTSKLKEPGTKLYGPDSQSGTYLFVYPQEGVAYLANSFRDTVYQVWYFPATTIANFLSLPQAAGYGQSPSLQPEGI